MSQVAEFFVLREEALPHVLRAAKPPRMVWWKRIRKPREPSFEVMVVHASDSITWPPASPFDQALKAHGQKLRSARVGGFLFGIVAEYVHEHQPGFAEAHGADAAAMSASLDASVWAFTQDDQTRLGKLSSDERDPKELARYDESMQEQPAEPELIKRAFNQLERNINRLTAGEVLLLRVA